MSQFGISHYFTPEGQKSALEHYSGFADESGWTVSEKIRLYVQSWKAFGSDRLAESVRREAFDDIYGSLSGRAWQAFRSSKPGPKWSAEKIFDVLRNNFSGFAWGDGLTLLIVLDANHQEALMMGLDSLQDIKSKGSYPLMTVSKFLHFFNPSLFPIYDGAIFEKRVFGQFNDDYETFCTGAYLNSKDSGAHFYRNYVSWAGWLLRAANPQFMVTYSAWLQDELSPRHYRWLAPELYGILYAAAFEFTAIGAMRAEESIARSADSTDFA